ncbi:MAG: HlyD family secretion protein [Candidatus Obscuribacterales bacterium]|nr:HlyD family secretion protein [Candidatus Obscuribacterales bacterium]
MQSNDPTGNQNPQGQSVPPSQGPRQTIPPNQGQNQKPDPHAQQDVRAKRKFERQDRLHSLDMVKIGWGPSIFGTTLLISFVICVAFFMFAPWRQSVAGVGEIIVFSPMHRPQTIEAQISGRLVKWYVKDGQDVTEGQLIAEISDIDPRFLSETQLKMLEDQKAALDNKRALAKERVESLSKQLDDQSLSRGAAVPAAQERIEQAKLRLFAAQQSVDVAEQGVKTTQWQLDRITNLYEKGLRSQREQQLALLDNTRAKTELQRAKAAYDVVSKDASIAGLDLRKVSADTSASINAIRASMADANQVIASTTADMAKIDIDIQNLTERRGQRQVHAPAAGRVVRLNRVGAGEMVNAGVVLATIAPRTDDRAAAILIRDYDAPLVSIGDPVRMSISGWPSLQFVGWPSVAVGTFAGRIAVIDAVDDGTHHYRIIVVPDKEAIEAKKEEPWPSGKYLRPGAQASGWVLLSYVPLWYELWRQFNGFQPTVPGPETSRLDRGSRSK